MNRLFIAAAKKVVHILAQLIMQNGVHTRNRLRQYIVAWWLEQNRFWLRGLQQ